MRRVNPLMKSRSLVSAPARPLESSRPRSQAAVQRRQPGDARRAFLTETA
ncbi:MAG: hypothetical protein MI751_11240 [Pseudomonadales bacterium]|nr:hypothetical protein [Pseudomonadales bacterium]MED5430799.1 hypothetical protein [Pseudomonadota bacterium]